jgi:hypothetical protein
LPIGRNNWLFAGSEGGGKATAVVGQGGDGLAATHAPFGNDALEDRSEVRGGSLAIPRSRQSWYRHA